MLQTTPAATDYTTIDVTLQPPLQLSSLLDLSGWTIGNLASEVGINRSTFSAKLHGHRRFSQPELDRLNRVLEESGAYERILRRVAAGPDID